MSIDVPSVGSSSLGMPGHLRRPPTLDRSARTPMPTPARTWRAAAPADRAVDHARRRASQPTGPARRPRHAPQRPLAIAVRRDRRGSSPRPSPGRTPTRATTFSASRTVTVCSGGVRNQLVSPKAATEATSPARRPPSAATAITRHRSNINAEPTDTCRRTATSIAVRSGSPTMHSTHAAVRNRGGPGRSRSRALSQRFGPGWSATSVATM